MVDADFTNKNILIVGLGLMGGSIARALKRAGVENVRALDKNPDVIAQAKKEGLIELGYTGSEEVLTQADFVVVCLYPELAVEFINENEHAFKSGALITDICGVKKPVVDNVCITRGDIEFVPAHPMAGSERQGFEFSFAELFDGCNYIICPSDKNSEGAVSQVEAFAKILGAKNIVKAAPAEHDEYIAYTSQIPHALAVAYMHSAKDRDILPFAGGSFRDVSRVALINEVMWAELFSRNAHKLADELESLEQEIAKIAQYVKGGQTQELAQYMKHGREQKEKYNAENNG